MKQKSREFRLDQTIGSVEPEKLEDTRKTIHEEIAQARAAVDQQEAGKPAAPNGKQEEPAKPKECTHPEGSDCPLLREAEDRRNEKLDLITDIQLIVIDRFQLLFKCIVAFCVFAVAAVAAGIFVGLNIKANVEDNTTELKGMVGDLRQAIEKQNKIAEKLEDTSKTVADTSKTVADTKEKVEEVAENVPKVEVDPKTGKKSLVVSEKKSKKKPDPAPQQYPPRPPWHKPPAPPPSGKVKIDVQGLQ